jgi:hypothetical protein
METVGPNCHSILWRQAFLDPRQMPSAFQSQLAFEIRHLLAERLGIGATPIVPRYTRKRPSRTPDKYGAASG